MLYYPVEFKKERTDMTNDLTKGSPLKNILIFALPLLIGNIFQQLYNIADTIIVGRTIGTDALAAVGAVGSLMWFMCGGTYSLTIGFSSVIARYFGAHDPEGLKKTFASSVVLTLTISVLVATLFGIFLKPILRLLNTPAELFNLSYRYFIFIVLGLPFTAIYDLIISSIRALGNSRTPLIFMIISCLVNIVLDFILIKFAGLSTEGAAIATIISQITSSILGMIYIIKKMPELHISKGNFVPSRGIYKTLISIGIPMAFLEMVLAFGGIIVQFATNILGTLYVTASTAANRIAPFVLLPVFSVSSALSVFSAQNFGAKKYSRIVEAAKQATRCGYLWNTAVTLIMFFGGGLLMTLVAGNATEQVIDLGWTYLKIYALMSFILSPLAMQKSVLQPLGRTFWSMVSGFTEIFGRALSSLALLAIFTDPNLQFLGICLSDPIAWVIGLLTVILDYIITVKRLKATPDGAEIKL